MIELIVFLFWIGVVVACGAVAANSNRSVIGWIICGFFLGIIALIILLCIGDSGSRSCPMCCEKVHQHAFVCRCCKYDFRIGEKA